MINQEQNNPAAQNLEQRVPPASESTFDQLDMVSGSGDITLQEKLHIVPLAAVMSKIKVGKYKEKVLQIRELHARGEKEAANKLKKTLSYFVYGIVSGPRNAANVSQANGIVLDFDHVADIEAFKAKAAANIIGAKYIFRSPNDGVKVLVQFSAPVRDRALYKRIWEAVASAAEQAMGTKPDATMDICRACFVSWDSELLCTNNPPLDIGYFGEGETDSGEVVRWPDGEMVAGEVESFQPSQATQLSPNIAADRTPPCTAPSTPGVHIAAKQDAVMKQGLATSTPDLVPSTPGVHIAAKQDTAMENGLATSTPDLTPCNVTDIPEVITGKVVDDPGEYYVRLAVEYLCQQKIAYREWSKVCIALYNHMGDAGKQYWDMFLHNPHYPHESQENLDKMWSSLQKYPSIKIASLFWIAGNLGWRNVVAPQSEYYSLEDYPELISMFAGKKDVPLDRSKLPEVLTDYIDILNQITDSSEGAKLTAFLPVVACCIGNRIAINNAGTRHFCNIWAVIIGPSGISRKSTVINQALKCLHKHKDSLSQLSSKEKIEQGIELNKPTQARLLNLLSIDANRLIVQTEIGAWMAEMQKSYNQGMKAELTDMFDGSDKAVAKVGIDEYISKPAFSIIGGSTEEWFMRELKDVSDQMGGFLQRHIICFYREIDVNKMDFNLRSCSHLDKKLHEYGEALETLRSLKGTHYLKLGKEAAEYRNNIYTAKMRENAPKGSDPLVSYITRIYDNYFFRLCMLLFALKYWQDIRDAIEDASVSTFFKKREIDEDTAKEAMYLCDYYFENTKPFLADLAEAGKLENEKKIVEILRGFDEQEMPHHRLLTASKLTGNDFRRSIESLIERQGVICIERKGYQNRIARFYKLNPVLL